ncbi:MAG: hypothetical protein ACLP7J_12020 [Streptosporangiaceae bacterium]
MIFDHPYNADSALAVKAGRAPARTHRPSRSVRDVLGNRVGGGNRGGMDNVMPAVFA